MAATKRRVVPATRLRDQVYEIMREELETGTLKPGQRLSELELAARYGVSRTPVREALFQLAREGLLVRHERSFRLPTDSLDALRDRIEVHLLIDPALAARAARDGTDEQVRALARYFAAEKQAEESGSFGPFVQANYRFYKTLRTMCRNVSLARCAALLQDQFLFARNALFRLPDHRAIAVRHDGRILKAIQARNPELAAQMTVEYMTALGERFRKSAARAARNRGQKETDTLPNPPISAR